MSPPTAWARHRALRSVTVSPITVTLPVFVTSYVYVIDLADVVVGRRRRRLHQGQLRRLLRGDRRLIAWFEFVPPACAVRRVRHRAGVQVGLRDRVGRRAAIEPSGGMSPAGQVTVALSSVTVTGPASVDVVELFVTT